MDSLYGSIEFGISDGGKAAFYQRRFKKNSAKRHLF
jgi:hypothetical protein